MSFEDVEVVGRGQPQLVEVCVDEAPQLPGRQVALGHRPADDRHRARTERRPRPQRAGLAVGNHDEGLGRVLRAIVIIAIIPTYPITIVVVVIMGVATVAELPPFAVLKHGQAAMAPALTRLARPGRQKRAPQRLGRLGAEFLERLGTAGAESGHDHAPWRKGPFESREVG